MPERQGFSQIGRKGLLLEVLLFSLLAVPAGATVPADLCTGNPCNLTGARTVAADSVLDFPAGTNLVFKAGSVVTLAGSGVPRSLTIRAATITLEPNARIVALPIPDGPTVWGYASVSLEATDGDLALQGVGATTAKIEGQGNWATDVALTSAGDVTIDGSILNRGTGVDPYAGDVTVVAAGTITVSRDLDTTASGEFGEGGAISLEADGAVTVNAVLDASGSASPGAISVLSTGGDITVNARVDSSATADGDGGELGFEAPTGQISFGDRLVGNGSQLGAGDDISCGDGAALTIVAGEAVLLTEPLDVNGGQTCTGGAVDISAGTDFTMSPGVSIHARAGGTDSSGGSFTLFAGRDATLRAIDLSGAGFGGTMDATAAETLTITEMVDVRATAVEGTGGGASGSACTLLVGAAAAIDTRGDGDDYGIALTASGLMTIAGTLRSSTENRLVYLALLPLTAGATILPPAALVNDLYLTPCPELALCGNGTTELGESCDDANNVSCDGCANDCSRVDDVCGDGVRECSEQCDDGNTTSGDGCNADCTVPVGSALLFPGTTIAKGCQAEWKLFLANPAIDATSGLPRRSQKCTDGDPGCDVDGLNDLRCTFAAELCLRVDDPRIPSCAPAPLEFVRIGAPSPFSADPLRAQNGQTILDALAPFGLEIQVATTVVQAGPPFAGEGQCTEGFTVGVPRTATGAIKRNFRVASKDTAGELMQSNEVTLTCLPNGAICGNGTTETFEDCDDANTAACDGCSAGCRIEECGNGAVECAEQCDEGPANGTAGSECSASCTATLPALRIPGGGSKLVDCAVEWAAALPPSGVLIKRGLPSNSQRCTDGDPACDFDPAPGSCGLRLWACLGGDDGRIGCAGAQVNGVEIKSPRASASGPELAARNALLAALAGLGLPAGPGEECTERVDVTLPEGEKLRLKTRATTANGKRDSDSLKLSCLPAP